MTGDRCNGSAAAPHTNGAKAGGAHVQEQQPPPNQQKHSTPTAPYRLADVCYELRRKVLAFLGEDIPASDELLRNVQVKVRVSVDVIEQALRRYSLDQISLSYNGGKDCLVLLILILACLPVRDGDAAAASAASNHDTLSSHTPSTNDHTPVLDAPAEAPTGAPANGPSSAPPAPSSSSPSAAPAAAAAANASSPLQAFQAIYIVPPDPFPEVEEFVGTSTAAYHLDLARYPLPMRAALVAYLADRPAVRAIFMGTRRTDPHGEFLTHFTPTDAGWPQFMRVHPVIDWHYAEIWKFIRYFDIPFCQLYNHGFTSLGGTTDTRPNPALAKKAADGEEHAGTSFRPAYELMDDEEERLGRGRKGH